MTSPSPEQRERAVQSMFGRIAPRYDLMNRLMTFGMDRRLRKIVIRLAALHANDTLLDLASGTGDLAEEALNRHPAARVIAADFSLGMMQTGRRTRKVKLDFTAADALKLPFADEQFHAVVSGFLLRNVVNLDQALREQFRVLKPGGVFVALDTTRPSRNIFSPLIRFHTHRIIPWLGRLLSGDSEAYEYLPSSTDQFLSAEELCVCLQKAGFISAEYKRHMMDTVAIHCAVKP